MSDVEFRECYLLGYLDALDVLNRPSADFRGEPSKLAAWKAGAEHFRRLVVQERARLEEGVAAASTNDRPLNERKGHEDEGGDVLTPEVFSDLLYRQIASDHAFDGVEGASRKTPTEFVVYPFDGPALLVSVAPAKE